MGSITDIGSGLIPKDSIISYNRKSGVPDALDTVRIRHRSGGESVLIFKSYEEGLLAFESDAIHLVHLDEEPDLNIYISALMRTMTTDGTVYLTETPLKGMTELLVKLHDPSDDVGVTTATWDDAPHLSQEQKDELWRSIPEFQRDARAKGIPQLGSGAIYPIMEDDIKCAPFEIPKHWKRGFGMDVGWNFTAVCWMAHDQENDILYIYGTYKGQKAEPSIHASAIKARGNLKGFIDPASRGRSQVDGTQLIELYSNQGLDLTPANNAVEAGIYEVWERLSTGRIKIFSTERAFFEEYRLYRRDDKGKIVKEHDHLLDAFRYGVMGRAFFEYTKEAESMKKVDEEFEGSGIYNASEYGWMA